MPWTPDVFILSIWSCRLSENFGFQYDFDGDFTVSKCVKYSSNQQKGLLFTPKIILWNIFKAK